MKKTTSAKNLIHTISNFFVFFLLAAFVTTCCLMLFISTLQKAIGRPFTREEIAVAAKITMVNVILISMVMAIVDYLRRKITVERPVKRITEAASQMIQGDFSVRIEPIAKIGTDDSFNAIIECINQMAEELSGVETLRTDFIANVSHEMKTPLAIIQNYGTLLQDLTLPEDKRIEYAKAITDACRRLANLITNILKLNKLENQQIYPVAAEYDLSEQICECLLQFEEAWEKKNLDIETDMEDGVMITSDAELLAHVWNNLFSNAIKFTETGGRVSVSLKTTEHHLIVKVSDTGCGMSPEVGAHIFDKFYQGDTSHSTQGNGLGLALVKRVVDIMQGEICVESRLGEGSTFTVKLRRV